MNAKMDLTGDKELDMFFRTITPSMQRGALRKAMRAAGSALVKEIRNNISRMVGESAASRGGQTRYDSRGKKTSLKKSIGTRPWAVPRRGIIGVVVGPRWPEGAHGHLVEFGHEIVSHGKRTGQRTRPIPFQRRAMVSGKAAIVAAQRTKLKQALSRLRAR